MHFSCKSGIENFLLFFLSHFLKGKCEIYTGFACAEYFKGRFVYVEAFLTQTKMEEQITAALGAIGNGKYASAG